MNIAENKICLLRKNRAGSVVQTLYFDKMSDAVDSIKFWVSEMGKDAKWELLSPKGRTIGENK